MRQNKEQIIDSVATIYNTDSNSALTSWKTIESIQNGLGGGVEIIVGFCG